MLQFIIIVINFETGGGVVKREVLLKSPNRGLFNFLVSVSEVYA